MKFQREAKEKTSASLTPQTSFLSHCNLFDPQRGDGRNPANQLRLVVYPIIYRVFVYIPGG